MGGDGVYYSDINVKVGGRPLLKRMSSMLLGQARHDGGAGLLLGRRYAVYRFCRFAQGCSSMALACEYTNNPDYQLPMLHR